jgi:hypothetical protein
MKCAPKPCKACPWQLHSSAGDIPNFDLELAERLARTCPDARGMGPEFGATIFACHESKPGREHACAGWLAAVGHAHPAVRLAVVTGRLDASRLSPRPGWPQLHQNFQSLIAKLRADAGVDA